MRIGVISDTHGLLRPEALAALRGRPPLGKVAPDPEHVAEAQGGRPLGPKHAGGG